LSEGGFKPNKVVAASLLDVATAKDKSGVNYYKYDILTRTGPLPPEFADKDSDKALAVPFGNIVVELLL
jgi:hypothetical protein